MLESLKAVFEQMSHLVFLMCCSSFVSAVQMVEKSEFRMHGAQAVGMLTSQMKSNDYACFVKWLSRFSRSAKVMGMY